MKTQVAVEPIPHLLPITAGEIHGRNIELGTSLAQFYSERFPLLIGVLHGALYFMADLSRRLSFKHEIDTVHVASYGSGTESSGVIRVLKEPSTPVTGRHVLIVEDIVDTGLTTHYLRRRLLQDGAATVRVVTCLTKEKAREEPEYAGFSIPNEFVVGYGMDHAGAYRGLPYITTLDRLKEADSGTVQLALA
jgi:hypoxanthine phosphoribosyltransferase